MVSNSNLRVLPVPEVDFDVEEYQGDEGRDPEDDSEGQVHVELDVHRVIPETVKTSFRVRYNVIFPVFVLVEEPWSSMRFSGVERLSWTMSLTLKAIITLIRSANKRWVRQRGRKVG